MKKSKTIVVTGGAGFVGGHLVEALLARGYRVVCVDLFTYAGGLAHLAAACAAYPHCTVDRVLREETIRDEAVRLVIMRGDINDTSALARLFSWCDGVMALAAETHVDYSYHAPEIFVRANINGTQSVLEAFRLAGPGKRLLHVSTDEVYGEVMKGFSAETASFKPRNVYAATKACGDLLVQTQASVFKLDVVTVRPCNMYGPRQQPKDLIPKTFSYLKAGRKMTIHGNGLHIREYLYVKDAVGLMIEVFERGQSGACYNLSSHVFRTTLQVVAAIARVLGHKPDDVMTFVEDRPNPDRRYAGDNASIRKLLGRKWKLTSFKQGVAAMADDFRGRAAEDLP